MNTRGLTELVILTIGLNLGVLSDTIFAMMVVMALTTTFMAAPIVSRLFPRERILKELAAEAEPAEAPTATRILVVLRNLANAPALVEAAVRLTLHQRPAELLLVRLIPTSRTPELRTGLFDEEDEMDASVESMRHLVEQAERSGVSARPLSYLSNDVGKDLALIASDNKCQSLLLGWELSGMPESALRLLVRRAFSLARCDVVMLVDPANRGVAPSPDAPVVLVLSGGSHDDAAAEVALRLAGDEGVSLHVLGFASDSQLDAAAASRQVALYADGLRERAGSWVVPHFHEDALTAAKNEAAQAALAVIGAGDDWTRDRKFGATVTRYADSLSCPVLVVRGAGGIGAPSTEPGAAAAEDWPFITPIRERTEPPQPVQLPAAPHLQRLDPYGYPVEAHPVGAELTIGRAPGNRLVLAEDNLVSRSHAAIESRNGLAVLQDMGSTNGTMLWRDREWNTVKEEELRDGDLLVIGTNVFRYSAGVKEA